MTLRYISYLPLIKYLPPLDALKLSASNNNKKNHPNLLITHCFIKCKDILLQYKHVNSGILIIF